MTDIDKLAQEYAQLSKAELMEQFAAAAKAMRGFWKNHQQAAPVESMVVPTLEEAT